MKELPKKLPKKLPKSLEKTNYDTKEFEDYIKNPSTDFIVVEGNRRLATAKLLTDIELREKLKIKNWPVISRDVESDSKANAGFRRTRKTRQNIHRSNRRHPKYPRKL